LPTLVPSMYVVPCHAAPHRPVRPRRDSVAVSALSLASVHHGGCDAVGGTATAHAAAHHARGDAATRHAARHRTAAERADATEGRTANHHITVDGAAGFARAYHESTEAGSASMTAGDHVRADPITCGAVCHCPLRAAVDPPGIS